MRKKDIVYPKHSLEDSRSIFGECEMKEIEISSVHLTCKVNC